MKLIAEIEGEKFALDVRREGERVAAEIDGQRYELEARELEKNAYLLISDGRVYECRVDNAALGAQQQGGAREVLVGDRSYSVALSDPKRLRDAKTSGVDAGGRASIVAPMPGKVVRVMVEQGATVEAGDGLVVVEAMKMQNEMKSPKSGKVAELHTQAGATVSAGDVLVIVE